MNRQGVLRRAVMATALGLTLGAQAARAQAPSVQQVVPIPQGAPRVEQVVPTPQQLRPADQVAPEERRRRGDIFEAPEAGPCPLRDSQLSFQLNAVSFTGADNLDVAVLNSAFQGEVGRTLPVSEICSIRDRAMAILFSRGILARVEIPQQRIAAGRLTLEVIEARVVAIHFHGDGGPSEPRVEALLEHLRGMTPFNLRQAQRYLLLAADIPGVQVAAAIRPSAQGRGAVELDVTVSHRAIEGAVNFQNYNSKSLGREAGLVRLDLDSATPFGDRTSVVLYSTSDLREQRVAQVIEELRPFDDGLILHGSLSYARTRPGSTLEPLDLHGNALTGQVALNYPLIRRRREDLNLLAGLDYVDEKTSFSQGGGNLIDDKLRVLFWRAQGDRSFSVLGAPVALDGGVELRKGLQALGASHAGASALSRTEGQADAFVARMDARLDVRPNRWFELVGAMFAQTADRPLLTFEEVSIGNLTIGRGYDPSSVAGDRGIAGSVEPRFGPFTVTPWLSFSPYAFYDVAYVKYIDSTGQNTTVHSAGGGVRFALSRWADLDVTYAAPFDKPVVSAASVPFPRVLVALTARY